MGLRDAPLPVSHFPFTRMWVSIYNLFQEMENWKQTVSKGIWLNEIHQMSKGVFLQEDYL